jgi:hypothetical protein
MIRFLQGIGVGGEWGGSVLLSMEWARVNSHRGFVASWPQFGAPAGLLLANVAVLTFSWLSGDQFLVWGWRIPFLLSIVMAAVGLYIRLGILETPAFQRLVAEKRIERVPVLEVFKQQPKEITLSALARTGEQAPAYIFLAFVFAYGTQVLHTPRNFLLFGAHRRLLSVAYRYPTFRASVGSDRTQALVSHWCGCEGDFRFHLFRHAELSGAGLDLPRHHALLRDARHSLWAAGSVDSRVLHPSASLQRLLDRLPSCLDRGMKFGGPKLNPQTLRSACACQSAQAHDRFVG